MNSLKPATSEGMAGPSNLASAAATIDSRMVGLTTLSSVSRRANEIRRSSMTDLFQHSKNTRKALKFYAFCRWRKVPLTKHRSGRTATKIAGSGNVTFGAG